MSAQIIAIAGFRIEKQRRAAAEEAERERDAQACAVAVFIARRLGPDGLHELLGRMHGTDWHRVAVLLGLTPPAGGA